MARYDIPELPRNVIYRQRAARFASIVAVAGLLLGAAGALWNGGLSPFLIGSLVVGAVALVTWIALEPSEAIGLLTGRRARHGTVSLFATALLIGIVVLTYVITQRAVITVDMTLTGEFSLSNETVTVLNRVNRPMQITGFYTPDGLQFRETDDQFIRLYEVETDGLIQRRYVDPQAQPAIAQQFAPFAPAGFIQEGDLFLSFLNDDGSVDFSTVFYIIRESSQERDITNAVVRLLTVGDIAVYIETDYHSINPLSEEETGLSRVVRGMQNNGISVRQLQLEATIEQGVGMPPDADALILRADRPLPAPAIALLDDYLNNGGALFIIADAQPPAPIPPFLAEDSAFNNYLWDNYGLRLWDAIVVDYVANSESPLFPTSGAVFPDLQIAARLNEPDDPNSVTRFRLARAIEVNNSPPVPNGRVIATSPNLPNQPINSYAERNTELVFDENAFEFSITEDNAGPLTLVAWANNPQTGAKILLVGDGDFVTNRDVISPLGNSILFSDGMAWLTDLGNSDGFSPQMTSTTLPLVFVDTRTLDIIGLITMVIMPGSVLLAGLFVWVRRSRR